MGQHKWFMISRHASVYEKLVHIINLCWQSDWSSATDSQGDGAIKIPSCKKILPNKTGSFNVASDSRLTVESLTTILSPRDSTLTDPRIQALFNNSFPLTSFELYDFGKLSTDAFNWPTAVIRKKVSVSLRENTVVTVPLHALCRRNCKCPSEF